MCSSSVSVARPSGRAQHTNDHDDGLVAAMLPQVNPWTPWLKKTATNSTDFTKTSRKRAYAVMNDGDRKTQGWKEFGVGRVGQDSQRHERSTFQAPDPARVLASCGPEQERISRFIPV